MSIRLLLLTTVASFTAVASVHAQTSDPNWTGPYVGLHVGATLDNQKVGSSGVLTNNYNALQTNARPGEIVLDRNGAEGGGQIGYNYQYGRLVTGLEADIALADADASQRIIGPVASGATQNSYLSSKLDDLGTVRARFGYLITPRVLLYGTGGYAYGDVKYRADFANSAGALAFTGGDRYTAGGYTYGAGVEYAYPVSLNLLGHQSAITLRAEYLHYDLGSKQVNIGAVGGVGTGGYVSTFRTLGNELRTAINFKF